MKVTLRKSSRKDKKYVVDVDGVRVHFGQRGAPDFTTTGDTERRSRYIARHRKRENWGKSGKKTAGFWARWLLWNKKTISASKKDITKKYGINFV